MKRNKKEFSCQITDVSAVKSLETSCLFDKSYIVSKNSPIDQFIIETTELAKLIPQPDKPNARLANLILLGGVSAVESYFRSIIRRTICIDKISKKTVEKCTLSYGAAIHHKEEMLPEALLETTSFVSRYTVREALKNFLGIEKQLPNEVSEVLGEYVKVCQLRHCVVHRFGKLGSNNAIDLDLDSHKELLEKPLKLDFNSLQEIFLTLSLTVKTTNNFIFRKLLTRTSENDSWEWDLRKDKKQFSNYYDTFSSQLDTPPSKSMNEIYQEFKNTFK